MVQLIAMVKPFRAQAVLEALQGVPIHAGTVREAMGFGRQKHRLHRYLGSEFNSAFLPKVEISLFLDDADVDAAIRAIVGPGRTGRMGDGKVLVLRCLDQSVRW